MVSNCCLKDCPTLSGQGLKLHKIPKDTELRLKWLKFIRSIDRHFIMKPSHLLCENHFFDSEYSIPTTSLKKQKKLKKNAVPSVVGIICIDTRRLVIPEKTVDTTAIELVEEEEEVQIPPDLFVDDISMYNINDGLEEDASLSAEILINEICLDPMIDNDFVEEIIVDSKPLTAPPSQFTHSDQRKRKTYFEDFDSPSDIETSDNRMKYWYASQSVVVEQKKKLRKLTKDNKNLRLKIRNLSSIVKRLNEERKTC